MKMYKKTGILLTTIILMVLSCFSILPAQTFSEKDEINENDPIVAMLDSLVSQNYLSKINYASLTQISRFKSLEIPVYSDETYAKRLSVLKTPIPLNYNQSVKNYIDLYAVRKKDLTAKVMGLSQIYFPMFEQILDQQGLPLEFKYLAIVESALNPMAVSKAGATGIWQFMYNTAKMYSLNINSYVDERKDPYKATYAACAYFKNMYSIYKDWLLVIAAYNCGPGNVNKAIARSGGKTNFWEISKYLPAETRGYVPAFIAVNYVMNYAAEHNISSAPVAFNYFETDTVQVNRPISFEYIESKLNIPVSTLEYLNPSYKKHIIPAYGDVHTLRLPASKSTLFAANADALYTKYEEDLNPDNSTENDGQSDAGYIISEVKKIYAAKKGEKLLSIAKKYNCSVSDLRQWNNLKNTRLTKNQKITVFVTVKQKIQVNTPVIAAKKVIPQTPVLTDSTSSNSLSASSDSAAVSNITTASLNIKDNFAKSKYIYHVVQRGDTLWTIAKKYEGVTVAQLKQLNRINGSRSLKPGTKIRVSVNG